jgi:uncharacterized membrane protein
MAALANILGLLKLSIGQLTIHLLQLPIILTGLVLGALAGGAVGLVGAILGALTLSPPNPYIILGNAILGFFTGVLYDRLRGLKAAPIVPQSLALLGAFLLQAPYAYMTDVYLMAIPSAIAQLLLLTLFIEDVLSLLICHIIIFRVDILKLLG